MALSPYCGDRDIVTPIEPLDETIRFESTGATPRNYRRKPTSWGPSEWARFIRSGRRPPDLENHVSAARVRSWIGSDAWREYFKFCFERNPFDKVVSMYFWDTKHQEPRPPITDWVLSRPARRLSNWDIYSLKGEIAVDFVGRYEQLETDWARIRGKLQLPGPLDLPRAKAGHRPASATPMDVLTEKARERIAVLCAREIAAFGYDVPS